MNDRTITVTLPSPVYGMPGAPDEVNITKGEIIRRTGYIESYSGEVIPGAYISGTGGLDIGTWIIYELETPIIESITPAPIPALPGVNTLYANASALTVTGSVIASGDMQTSVYDTNANGQVDKADDADRLGNVPAADYITMEALNALLDQRDADRFDAEHPVGDVLLTMKEGDPAVWLGRGTWARIAKGRTLFGVDEDDPDFAAAGLTGGAKAHAHTLAIDAGGAGTTGGTALTVAQLPAHTHGLVSLTGWFGEWALQDSSTTEPYVGGIITASSTGSYQGYGTSTTGSRKDRINIDASHEHASVGSGQAHTHPTPNHTHTGTAEAAPANTLPPYETCYIWKRIA